MLSSFYVDAEIVNGVVVLSGQTSRVFTFFQFTINSTFINDSNIGFLHETANTLF